MLTLCSVINQRLYLLSQLKTGELPSDSLQIVFHALILSKVESAQLQLQDSSPKVTNIGYAFFRKAKTTCLCHSDFFVSQLIDSDHKLEANLT